MPLVHFLIPFLFTGLLSQAVPVPLLFREEKFLLGEPSVFRDDYSVIWGEKTNFKELPDGTTVQLILDDNSGSGFKSKETFPNGLFSASIRLPANYTAGVVTAFYISNEDKFPLTHDELDFEFLGVVPGMKHILQTNIYSNGSVHTGREERIHLWFDPTADFHQYTVLWNRHQIVFFVDNIPVRQMRKVDVQNFPSKPMSLYATIWDGSNWATSGGKFPVDYTRAPFISTFTNLIMVQSGPSYFVQQRLNSVVRLNPFSKDLSWKQKAGLGWVREHFMAYTYCRDGKRYPKALPECKSLKKLSKLYSRSLPSEVEMHV